MARYRLQIYEQDGEWGWSILDYVGDEIAASDSMFPTRVLAGEEGRAALSDYNDCFEDYRYEQ